MLRNVTSMPLSCRMPRSYVLGRGCESALVIGVTASSMSSVTGASPTSRAMAVGAGATPVSSSATGRRCWSTRCSTSALTEAMLAAMADHTRAAPIGTVVNTHANGDHCYGNQLVGGAQIVASSATAHEMSEVPPSMLAALNAARGRGRRPVPQLLRRVRVRRDRAAAPGSHVRRSARARRRWPRRRADRGRPRPHPRRHARLRARCGDDLHRRHPVHRWHADRVGRAAVELDRRLRPDARHGRRHRRARSRPGHRQGRHHDRARLPRVRRSRGDRTSRRRRRRVRSGSRHRAHDPRPEDFGELGEFGRIAVNVDAVYRALDPDHRSADVVEQFRRMAELERR